MSVSSENSSTRAIDEHRQLTSAWPHPLACDLASGGVDDGFGATKAEEQRKGWRSEGNQGSEQILTDSKDWLRWWGIESLPLNLN